MKFNILSCPDEERRRARGATDEGCPCSGSGAVTEDAIGADHGGRRQGSHGGWRRGGHGSRMDAGAGTSTLSRRRERNGSRAPNVNPVIFNGQDG
jgi:hypothetical protein